MNKPNERQVERANRLAHKLAERIEQVANTLPKRERGEDWTDEEVVWQSDINAIYNGLCAAHDVLCLMSMLTKAANIGNRELAEQVAAIQQEQQARTNGQVHLVTGLLHQILDGGES